jgi:uncharacterized caspase-like protein
VGPLKNPINDINLVAASLRKIGFTKDNIQILPNATRKEILRAVDRYARVYKNGNHLTLAASG